MMLFGAACLFIASSSPIPPFWFSVGTIAVLLATAVWQEQRWAVSLGMLLFGLSAIARLVGLFVMEFRWTRLCFFVVTVVLAYECWEALGAMGKVLDDEVDEGDDDDRPMISFVLLQKEAKYLESMILAKMIEAAWGGDYSTSDENEADGFVVGESPMFVVNSPHGTFLVHNHDSQYWDDTESLLEEVDELRLHHAIAQHQAWLSVDLISPAESDTDQRDAYALILKLIQELADDDTLVMLQPETMRINVWSDELAASLNDPNAIEEFAEQQNVPVVRIEEDDPRMLAAVETARRRWPEFVEAFQSRSGNDEDKFSVKAPIESNGNVEFIWLDVIGLEPNYIHGTLANDPVDLGDLVLGSQVEVPVKDLNDWAFFKDGVANGMFTVAAIHEAQDE